MNSFLLKLSFVFAIGAHGADLASTEYCLGKGSCSEMNKFLARFNQPAVFGGVKMGVAAGSEVGIYELSKEHPKLAFIANITVGTIFTGIAVHNSTK